jgi:hypothetical protein
MLNTLYGWSETDLLTELDKLQNEWMKTARVRAAGAGDVNAEKLLQSVEERLALVKRSLYAINTTTYASFANEGETVTRAGFF